MALPLIVDNDAILKLTACNLLDETLSLLNCSQSNVLVLDAARYAFRNLIKKQRPSDIEKYSLSGLERAVAFAENAKPIVNTPNLSIHDLLTDIPNIDPEGDINIVDKACELRDAILLTGDKRCIRAIATSNDIRFVYNSLATRIICFEEVIRALIIAISFESVRDAVVPVLACDKVLRSAFGSGMQTTEENAINVLVAYIDDLEKITGKNWLRKL